MSALKEYIAFFSDRRFLAAILVLLVWEFLLQMGCYKPFLKKNSYAANVNRITSHAVKMRNRLDPDILILGTSVAFEGLSVRILNEVLEDTGLKVQTLAIPGSELVVQHQVVERYLNQFPKTRVVLHVMEAGMPWVDREELVLPTLAMLSELGNFRAIQVVHDFRYQVGWEDWTYLIFKSIAYRRDLKDFFAEPHERIKFLGREWKEPNQNPWEYENTHEETVSAYKVKTIHECIEKTRPDNKEPIPKGSTERHKKMLYDTCVLSKSTTQEKGKTERTDRYFSRLSKIYEKIPKDRIKVVHVFAPYSELIYHFGKENRMPVWKEELNRVTRSVLGYSQADIIDLESLLDGEDNGDYCFDLIHLNRFGMEKFSLALGKILRERYLNGELFLKN